MKPVTIRGVEYFPVLSISCRVFTDGKEFDCAFRRQAGFTCALLSHERRCMPDSSGREGIIHLTKEQYALAVLLGAEVPA